MIDFEKYKFILKPVEDISLPAYKGSTLRGGFGVSFKKICCIQKSIKNCYECLLKNKCIYFYIFETSPHPNLKYLKNLKDIPRPFVIEPPLETKQIYKKEENLEFNLILIGKSIKYFPYFILAFKELGKIGIGKGRGRYSLYKVENFKNNIIYNSEDGIIRKVNSKINIDENAEFPINNSLSLNFITPTRIKYKDDLVVIPEFHILIRSLLHRISSLSYFHCNKELKLDYNLLILKAEDVKIEKNNLKWTDWERYSSRQDTKMKLGGFIGDITYKGNFKDFSRLILIGEQIHIGKNCTFGLGKYEIIRKR